MRSWRIIGVAIILSFAVLYATWAALADKSTLESAAPSGMSASPTVLVQDRINDLEIGKPQSYRGLTVFPLIGPSVSGLDYLTLDEAMDKGALVVREKGSGEVNMVLISNKSGKRIFVMDGEEIVGAKQNRILNSSVMIPNSSRTVEIPVSCVEHGRWVGESMEFKSGGTQLFAGARQSNAAAVSKNYDMAPSAGPQSDQQMIWDKVGEKRDNMSLGDTSGPMHEAYIRYDGDINSFISNFHVIDRQVGAVFAINGKIVGADIFDQHATLQKLFPKLVKSYALDAIEKNRHLIENVTPKVSPEAARDFLREALGKDVTIKDYKSPGEGRDVRITGDNINGSSLIAGPKPRPVHIALFASEEPFKPLPVRDPGPIRPATERRNSLR